MNYAFTRAAQILAVLAVVLGAPAAAKPAVYTLLGFNLKGIPGIDQKALEAKLRHKPGDRITEADTKVDKAIIEKELQARHIEGRIFTTLAERNGRVWVIFDLLDTRPADVFNKRKLEAQHFEGVHRLSAGALEKATGLKPGDPISPARLNAARQAIAAAYAKAVPGKPVQITGKIQGKDDGETILTWTIREP
jgi:Surface antigen variable number repeat